MLLLKFRRFRLGRQPYAVWALVCFCLCGLATATPTQASTPTTAPSQTNETSDTAELTWIDPATHLVWAKKDRSTGLDESSTSEVRSEYCHNLQLAGITDWRLPTIDELSGIFDQNLHDGRQEIKGNIQLGGDEYVWSSTKGARNSNETLDDLLEQNGLPRTGAPKAQNSDETAWVFDFFYGKKRGDIPSSMRGGGIGTLCVYAPGPSEREYFDAQLNKQLAIEEAGRQRKLEQVRRQEEKKRAMLRQLKSEPLSLGLRSGMSQPQVKAILMAHGYANPAYLAPTRPWVCASNGWKNGRLTTGCVAQKGAIHLVVVFEFGIAHLDPDTGETVVKRMDRLFYAQFGSDNVGRISFSDPQYKSLICTAGETDCHVF